MMRNKQITIGEMSFKNHSEAKAYIKELLNSQQLKHPIPEPDHSFLAALVARHPDSAAKIGAGIKHFTVEPAAHGTHCFYITRVDGSRDDFSTKKCFGGSE